MDGGEPWRPLNAGWGRTVESRRMELFKLAAPVFEQHGYRGSTIKALAHACHLSPASLYHYFPSKAALATCLLDRPPMGWDEWDLDAAVDPLDQLRRLLDLALEELPHYLLALRLAREMGRDVRGDAFAARFGEGEALIGRLIQAAAPDLAVAEAVEVARRLLGVLIGPAAVGVHSDAAASRARAIDLLRLHLVSEGGVDAARFEAAMSRG
ncbi:MAG TPA: helix-turn-helix domain-containing protein [Candidatus Limnocylindrales bacterium]|nr:helix-turn-helix domain-containing protein [Candidatus Limnocylindrales bacterium]